MKITAEMLLAKHACAAEVDRFAKFWPDGAEVNEENAAVAIRENFNVGWLAAHCFSPRAWAAYRAIDEAAWSKYQAADEAAEEAAWSAFRAEQARAFVAAARMEDQP